MKKISIKSYKFRMFLLCLVKSHALEGLYIDHGRTMSLSLNDKEFSDLSTKLLDLAALDLGNKKKKKT